MLCIQDMKRKYLIWVFLCYLTNAHLLTFNYTLSEDNLVWSKSYLIYPVYYPVLDSSLKIIQNGSSCLAFYPSFQKFGVFVEIAGVPVMVWDSGATVRWGSTFVLDSTGTLVLRNDSNQKVWSTVPGIERFEMEWKGNFVLYDGNETAVWQSIDHPSSDVVFFGQNFTKLSNGGSSVVIENGNLTVKQGNKTYTNDTGGGLTAGLRCQHDTLGLTSFNSSGMQTSYFLQVYQQPSYCNIQFCSDFTFISLQEDGSFNVCSLVNGSWITHSRCFESDEGKYTECQQISVFSPFLDLTRALLICILIASLPIMIYSEVRFSIYTNSHHHILLHMLLLASVAAILFSSLLAIIRLFQYQFYAKLFAIISIDMIILQVSVRGILHFLLINSPLRRRLLFILIAIALPFIIIFLGCSAFVGWLLSQDLPTIYTYTLRFGFFNLYPLPIFNNIILVAARLPCCSGHNCNRWCCPIGLIVVDIILVAATTTFSKYYEYDPYGLWDLWNHYYFWSLQSLNLILIAISIWACFAHNITSLQAKLQMMRKKIHVWLLSRLLGKPEPPGEDDITISLSSYSYPEMEVVTNHFGKQIGRGGFGGVYEGVLLDGRKVAVKKLESNSQGRQEFKSEIETLGKLHHVNLVQLLGFCAEGTYKLLIYEFMPNGSLDKWIFNADYLLDWPQRMKIILGTAQGLAYLHQECNPRILHLDVKPQNILLDESFTTKVADFGLCKLMPADETSLILTKMMGTFGYLAPEWVNGSVSEKSDIYSFGIVVLEVVSGRRSYSSMVMTEEISFLNWASQRCEDGTLLDSRLAKDDYDAMELKRVIDVAFCCACQDANMRPSMNMVVKMLEGNSDYTLPLERGSYPINQQSSFYSNGEEWSQEVSLR